MFVNPVTTLRRNGVRVVGIRVKKFKEGETNNPASVFSQTIANWVEVQLRFSLWSEEDRKCFKDYFNTIGEELWPINQLEFEDGEGLGSAFFGTIDEFNNAMGMLGEENQYRVMEEMFEVGFMDKNQWRKWAKSGTFIL